jgi:hypothetical protein
MDDPNAVRAVRNAENSSRILWLLGCSLLTLGMVSTKMPTKLQMNSNLQPIPVRLSHDANSVDAWCKLKAVAACTGGHAFATTLEGGMPAFV